MPSVLAGRVSLRVMIRPPGRRAGVPEFGVLFGSSDCLQRYGGPYLFGKKPTAVALSEHDDLEELDVEFYRDQAPGPPASAACSSVTFNTVRTAKP